VLPEYVRSRFMHPDSRVEFIWGRHRHASGGAKRETQEEKLKRWLKSDFIDLVKQYPFSDVTKTFSLTQDQVFQLILRWAGKTRNQMVAAYCSGNWRDVVGWRHRRESEWRSLSRKLKEFKYKFVETPRNSAPEVLYHLAERHLAEREPVIEYSGPSRGSGREIPPDPRDW
jgi:hypothetical protein